LNDQDSAIYHGLRAGHRERMLQEKELYTKYYYFIEEGCKKHSISQEDSFSAYSDAVLSVIHNIVAGRFDGRSSIKTYLFQIFFNKCVDLIRKSATNKEQVNETNAVPELLMQLPDNARNAVTKMMDEQKREAIRTHLQTLGERCREILILFEDGFTDNEIAKELAYNNSAVAKTTRLRCLEKLREKVSHLMNVI